MKEKYLDMIIAVFGFEHPYTISIATMIESNVSDNTIKQTVEGLIAMRSL
jgi:hypothetical protein